MFVSCMVRLLIPFQEIGGHSGMAISRLLASPVLQMEGAGSLDPEFHYQHILCQSIPSFGPRLSATGSILVTPASLELRVIVKACDVHCHQCSLLGD